VKELSPRFDLCTKVEPWGKEELQFKIKSMIKSKNFKSRSGSYLVALLMLCSLSAALLAPVAVWAYPTDAQIKAALQTRGWSTDTRDGNYGFHLNEVLKDIGGAGGIAGFVDQLGAVINAIVPFLVGLAVLIVIYGIVGYILNAADEEKRKEGQKFVIWGIVGIFVMISVWGLVNILYNTFHLTNTPDVVTNVYKPLDIPTTQIKTLIDLINRMNAVGSRIIPFLISIAAFIVILGVVGYIRQGDNEEKRAEGRMFIIWGIVSIFVMLSIWGFVNILVGTFDLNNTPVAPDLLPEYKPSP